MVRGGALVGALVGAWWVATSEARGCVIDSAPRAGGNSLAKSYMGLGDNENRAAAQAKRKLQPGARDRDSLLSQTV